jgi:PTS system cellobiose-specific IIB component
MAKNIRKVVKERNLDLSFIARSDSEINEYINEIDMLLLGPHLKYMYKDISEYAKPYKVPVYLIEQKIYGMLDGAALVDFVLEKLNDK